MTDKLAGIRNPGTVYLNPSVPELIERAIAGGEGALAASGALVSDTGERTGRSPRDRFFVAHGASQDRIDWGKVNQPVEPEVFDAILDRARAHLEGRDLFIIDGFVGADPHHTIKLRVITELAWHALFARQLFRRPDRSEIAGFEPEFVVVGAPRFETVPDRDGTNSNTFIGVDVERKQILICGSHYAGEMKKSIFTSANFLLPDQDVLPMHCSANLGPDGTVALFFGLSGTGKTTLSADPSRALIGDDEHGWSDSGVFNLEGGCYAKCINLSREKEPQIWDAIRFGAVVENTVMDPDTRVIDYADASKTENTRVAYPLEFIPDFVPEGRAGHASTVVFLTADAFGVLPPVSKLGADAAMYHFLSGFTSKLAGTEAGMGSEPQATFSTCFGQPFLPLAPSIYAGMLGNRIEAHKTDVYLVNTGWSGGPFGVGERMELPLTRAIIEAATSGKLRDVDTRKHPIFNLDVPRSCPGVPDQILDPQSTWPDVDAYEIKARELARMFAENFERFKETVPAEVTKAGPVAD